MNWVLLALVLVILGYLPGREVYFYEGVHLGLRAQAWLYDRWARKYDAGKRESQLHDAEMLARPLLEALKDLPEPFILDFATGTGRVSFALLNQPDFNGHIVALDLSLGMLEQAVMKRIGRGDPARTGGASRPQARIAFLRHPSLPLPFPDHTFDAVCALEVLELFPSMDEPLKELTRVLRPGGASVPAGSKNLLQVLHCRRCGHADWQDEPGQWTCRNCGETLPITESGIVLN